MGKETEAILRAVLFQVKTAKSLKQVEAAIKAMCSGDDISAVERQVQELQDHEAKE